MNCNSKRGLTTIQKAINLLQQGESSGANTILVSGNCKENVTIQSVDNLTLAAENGASISDPSNGNLDVADVIDSRRISVTGFTINGGAAVSPASATAFAASVETSFRDPRALACG